MRSPEARELLDNILRISRDVCAANGFCPGLHASMLEMREAMEAYDAYCNERHYSLSIDLVSSTTAPYVSDSKTKAEHFQLPLGR